MIEHILQCLKLDLKSDSEYIAIARGKNKLPMTIKEGYKQLKQELKWLKK
jgi:hypothetical protein